MRMPSRQSAVLRDWTELEIKSDALPADSCDLQASHKVSPLENERRWERGLRITPAKGTEEKQPGHRKSRRGWGPGSQGGTECRREGVARR